MSYFAEFGTETGLEYSSRDLSRVGLFPLGKNHCVLFCSTLENFYAAI